MGYFRTLSMLNGAEPLDTTPAGPLDQNIGVLAGKFSAYGELGDSAFFHTKDGLNLQIGIQSDRITRTFGNSELAPSHYREGTNYYAPLWDTYQDLPNSRYSIQYVVIPASTPITGIGWFKDHGTPFVSDPDTSKPGPSIDQVLSGNYHDLVDWTADLTIFATPLADRVDVGAARNASIHAGEGSDTIRGSSGDDIFWEVAKAGDRNNVNGGRGEDDLSHSGNDGGLVLNGGVSGSKAGSTVRRVEHISATQFADDVRLKAGETSFEKTLGDVERTIFTQLRLLEGDDKALGSAKSDLIYGHAGKDTIDGGKGQDFIYGGDGKDMLRGGKGADRLVGESGRDTLDGGAGMDTARLVGAMKKFDFKHLGSAATPTADAFNFKMTKGPGGKDRFEHVERLEFDDNVAPLVKWHFVVQRGQDGDLEKISFYENGKLFKPLVNTIDSESTDPYTSGSYDDATPILTSVEAGFAGGYEAVFRVGGKHKDRVELVDVEGRSAIQIHGGNTTQDSEGCIVVTKTGFLNAVTARIRDVMGDMRQTSANKFDMPVPITVEVVGEVEQPRIGFCTGSIDVDDTVATSKIISIDLSHDGDRPGISKRMELGVRVERSSGLTAADYKLKDRGGDDHFVFDKKADMFKVQLDKHETSIDLKLTVKANSDAEVEESLTFTIVDVNLFNDSKGYTENKTDRLEKLFLDDSMAMTVNIAADAIV